MEPRLFLVCSFLLNCLVSFLTGTAFGSAATMGAVCMTMAAALGAGVDITQPEGHMVVDIGGGTTDVAVTALGGVVASACLSTAGDQFDEALMQYIRQKHSLLIGARTAEEVKEAIGRVDGPGEETLAVKGRCLNTGLPREILLSGEETAEAFTPVAENIISAVQAVLERTPPELAADVAVSGILLTGGGSLLQGMDTLLAARTGMETHLAEDPIRAVALGLEQTLPHLAKTAGRGPEPGTPAAADGVRPSMEPSFGSNPSILCISIKKSLEKFPGFFGAFQAACAVIILQGNNSSRMCRAFFPPSASRPGRICSSRPLDPW